MTSFGNSRKLSITLAAVVLGAILIANHFLWFDHINEQVRRSTQSFKSDIIDLAKPGHIEWLISAEALPNLVNELLIINLSLSRLDDPGMEPDKGDRLKMALTVEAEAPGVTKTNRLIQNSFTPTNRPTDDRPVILAGWGGSHAEYLLGYTTLFAYDRLKITLEVIEPDPRLAKAQPRLMVVPSYDTTAVGNELYFIVLRNLSIALGLIALFWLLFCARREWTKRGPIGLP